MLSCIYIIHAKCRWSKSPYNDAHESQYGKRNFSRHKETIAELFSIEIVCDRSTNTALPAEPTAQNKNYKLFIP
jgi:hypothetical protein